VFSSGTTTSTDMIGWSTRPPAFDNASRTALAAAMRSACGEEAAPMVVTLRMATVVSWSGEPSTGPPAVASRAPSSTAARCSAVGWTSGGSQTASWWSR
jgi:hypothetical protein